MIRVFVGCAPNGEDAESQAVLEYTLRKHASQPVEIQWMCLSRNPASPFYANGKDGWQTQAWSTPFTALRVLVPELCGFKGRAIYTDSDTIWMADVAELWNQQFLPGKCVMAKTADDPNRLCISMWDCERARPHMSKSRDASMSSAMKTKLRNARVIQSFQGNWNCIDGEDYESLDHPDIKVIHYSLESAQPHLKYAVPRLAAEGRKHWFDGKMRKHWRADLIALFDRLYAEALAAGFTPERYAPTELFGNYRLQSHERYGGHQWAR